MTQQWIAESDGATEMIEVIDDDIVRPPCKHGRTGYCFDCVRERYNQDALDGKFDDIDEDFASCPHPSAYYDKSEQ